MKGNVCKVCGYISINGAIPEKCPVCTASKTNFSEADVIKTAADKSTVGETEKKHIPAITIVKVCGLIPENCTDAHVKVGEIQHPMLPEHFIGRIDWYIDNQYISRVYLTPEKLNPAAALHIKAKSGKLTAIAWCNVHGYWMAEKSL